MVRVSLKTAQAIQAMLVGAAFAVLFVGAGGRFGSVGHAWLPAPSRTARPPRKLPFRGESSAALTDGEKSALEALARAMER